MHRDDFLRLALEEDLGHGDITTDGLGLDHTPALAYLKAKANGVLCGLEMAERVFKLCDPRLSFIGYRKDGDTLTPGMDIAKIEGFAPGILKGERTALNILQRLSGIATMTARWAAILQPYHTRLLDTRKTTPLMRGLEKYAVRMGGACNHRFGLYDMVMLKENHLRAGGGITNAVGIIKKRYTSYKIEVETTCLKEVEEALAAGVDRIMLDNMSIADMEQAVKLVQGRVELEASGGITEETLATVAATGVDFISAGALTHSPRALDISLLFKEQG